MFDALRLERELRRAGIPLFATDEPIDTQAPDASIMLVRRTKQGIAEYFKYNLKAQMWEGLKQYAIGGHNTGRCPYGYAEDRTPHPNPMKAVDGRDPRPAGHRPRTRPVGHPHVRMAGL